MCVCMRDWGGYVDGCWGWDDVVGGSAVHRLGRDVRRHIKNTCPDTHTHPCHRTDPAAFTTIKTQQTVFIIFASVLLLVDILFQDFQFVFDPDPNVRRLLFYSYISCVF